MEEKVRKRELKITIALLSAAMFFLASCGNIAKKENSSSVTMESIEKTIEQEEYEEAESQLEAFLKDNPDDKKAEAISAQLVSMKQIEKAEEKDNVYVVVTFAEMIENQKDGSKFLKDLAEVKAKKAEETIATIEEYEKILEEAEKLNKDKKYEESNKKLNEMAEAELDRTPYKVIKESVEVLSETNSKEIDTKKAADADEKAKAEEKEKQEEKKKESEKSDSSPAPATNNSGGGTVISPDFVGSYSFYFTSDRVQVSLHIAADGSVVETTNDGRTFTGRATLVPANVTVNTYWIESNLSGTPNRKTSISDVQITVVWDNNGGTDVYYGYTSYGGQKVLSDGLVLDTGAINEVWVRW